MPQILLSSSTDEKAEIENGKRIVQDDHRKRWDRDLNPLHVTLKLKLVTKEPGPWLEEMLSLCENTRTQYMITSGWRAVQIINAVGILAGEEVPELGHDCMPGIVLGVFHHSHLRRGGLAYMEVRESESFRTGQVRFRFWCCKLGNHRQSTRPF